MGAVCLSKLLFFWHDLRLSVFVAECFYYLLLSVARAVLSLAAPADYLLRCYLIIVPFFGTIFYSASEVVKKEKRPSRKDIKTRCGGSSKERNRFLLKPVPLFDVCPPDAD